MKEREKPNGHTEGPGRSRRFMLAIALVAVFAFIVTSYVFVGTEDASAQSYTYGAGQTWEMEVELSGDTLNVTAAHPGTAVIPSTLTVNWGHGETVAKNINISGFHGGSPSLFSAMTDLETIVGDFYGNSSSYTDGTHAKFYSNTERVGTWSYSRLTNTLSIDVANATYNSKLMPNFINEKAPWTCIPVINGTDYFSLISNVSVGHFSNCGWQAFYGIDVAGKSVMSISGLVYNGANLVGDWVFNKSGSTGVLSITSKYTSLIDMPAWNVNTTSGLDERPWSHGTTYTESGIDDWEWYSSVTTVKVRGFQNYNATNSAFSAIDSAAITAVGYVDPNASVNKGEWSYIFRAAADTSSYEWFHTGSLKVVADTLTTMPSWSTASEVPWNAYTEWVGGITDVYIMGYNGYPSVAFSMIPADSGIYTVGYAYDETLEIGTWEFCHTDTDKNFIFKAYNENTTMPTWSIQAGNDKRPWAGYTVVITATEVISVGNFSNFVENNFYDFTNATTRQIIGSIYDEDDNEIGEWTYNNNAQSITLSAFESETMIDYTQGGAPWASIVTTNVVTTVYITGFTNISENALYGFSDLTTLESDSVEELKYNSIEPVINTLEKVQMSALVTMQNALFKDAEALREFTSSSIETIPDNAFKGCEALTVVTMNNATELGANSFNGCTALVSVWTASKVWIKEYAFNKCTSLETYNSSGNGIYLPEVVCIGVCAFQNCSSVTKATVGNVQKIGTAKNCWGESAFAGCTSMTEFYSDSVTEAKDSIFLGCSNMEKFTADALTSTGSLSFRNTFPNIVEVSLRSLRSTQYYNFLDCTKLVTVHLPTYESIGVNTCSLTHQCFRGCTSLTNINLDAVYFSSSQVFYGCTSLTSESVNTITDKADMIYNYTFYKCEGLTGDITLRNRGYICYDCFRECINLESVDLSPNKLANNYLNSRAFYGCTSLQSVVLPDAYIAIYNDCFAYCENLSSVTVKDSQGNTIPDITIPTSCTEVSSGAFYMTAITRVHGENLATVGDSCFESCTSLETVILPSVNVLNADSFRYCSSLTSVRLPDLDSETPLKTVGNYCFEQTSISTINLGNASYVGAAAFRNCKSLTSVTMPKVEKVENEAFRSCNLLATVTTGTLKYVGNTVFYECTLLEEIDLRQTTYIGSSAFSSCNNLVLTTDEDTNHNLNVVTFIGGSAFANCVKLTSVYAPMCTQIDGSAFTGNKLITEATLTSAQIIGGSAFYKCTKLVSATMPSATSIGSSCFSGCIALKYVTLPHEAGGILILGSYAFANCSSLVGTNDETPIYLDSVITIGYQCFISCTSLAGDLHADNVTTTDQYIFYNCDKIESISMNSATRLYYQSFYSCDSLEKVTAASVTQLDSSVFHSCSNLISVNVPSATIIGAASFYNCPNLKRVSCGDEVNNPELVIEKNMADLTAVETINSNSAFESTGLTEFKFGSHLTYVGGYAFYKSKATSIVLPNTVTTVGQCICGGSYIRELVIPDSVTKIGNYLFYYVYTTGDLNVYFNGGLDQVTRDTSGVTLHCVPGGATRLHVYMPIGANLAYATVNGYSNLTVIKENVNSATYNITTGLAGDKPTKCEYGDKFTSLNGSKVVLPYSFESSESKVYSDYFCVTENPYSTVRLGMVKANSDYLTSGFAKSGDVVSTYVQANKTEICVVGEVKSDDFQQKVTVLSAFETDPGDGTTLYPTSGEYGYGDAVKIPTLSSSKYNVESVVASCGEFVSYNVPTSGTFNLGTCLDKLTVSIEGHTVNITFIDGTSEETLPYDFGQPYGTLPAGNPGVGEKFKGWYTQSEGGYRIDETTKVTGEMRLYAQYEPMSYELVLRSNTDDEGPEFTTTLTVYGKYTLYTDSDNNLYVIDATRTEKTLIFDPEEDTKGEAKGYKLDSYWVDGFTKIDVDHPYADETPVKHDPVLLVWSPVSYTMVLNFSATGPLNNVYLPGLLHGNETGYYNNGDTIEGIQYSELEDGYVISVPMHQTYTFSKASVTCGSSTIELKQDVSRNCKMIVTLDMYTENAESIDVYFEFLSGSYRYQFVYNDDNSTIVDTTELIGIGSEITMKPSPSTKSGYVFKCWEISNGETAYDFDAGKTVTLTSEHIACADMGMLKFNAVWELKKYVIHFDMGEYKGSTLEDLEVNFDVGFELPVCKDYLGHTLSAWSWVTDDGLTVSDPISVKDVCKVTKDVADTYSYGSKSKPELNMVATWVNTTYTIYTEETAPSITYNDISADYLGTFTLWDGKNAYAPKTMTDVTFAGWVADGSPCYENLAEVVVDDVLAAIGDANDGKIEFSINWVQKQYTVKYDLDGGSDPDRVVPTSVIGPYKIGDKFEPPSGLTLTKEGYTFKGWKYDVNAFKAYTFDGTFDSTLAHYADSNNLLTLYAYWEQITYSITYDYDGGSAGQYAPKNGAYGSEVVISNPVRTGYSFAGWTATNLSSGAAVSISDGSWQSWDGSYPVTYTKFKDLCITKDGVVSFTATWDTLVYEVKYVTNADEGGISGTYSTKLKVEDTIILPDTSSLVKTGYENKGWGLDEYNPIESGTQFTSNMASYAVNNTITFYGVWTSVPYTITYTYYDEYGEMTLNAEYGSVVNIPAITRVGYTFLGWESSDIDPNTAYYSRDESVWYKWETGKIADASYFKNLTSVSGGSVSMVGHWELIDYKIKYTSNSTSAKDPKDDNVYNIGSSVTLVTTVEGSNNGKSFLGWSFKQGSTETVSFTEFTATVAANADITNTVHLYGVWSEGTYTVTVDLDGCTASAIPAGWKQTSDGKYSKQFDYNTKMTVVMEEWSQITLTKDSSTFSNWDYTNSAVVADTNVKAIFTEVQKSMLYVFAIILVVLLLGIVIYTRIER